VQVCAKFLTDLCKIKFISFFFPAFWGRKGTPHLDTDLGLVAFFKQLILVEILVLETSHLSLLLHPGGEY
jgi:hypothetical protein